MPYERPPLSKEFLLDAPPSARAVQPAWYEQTTVDLRLGTLATGLDPRPGTVTLSDGAGRRLRPAAARHRRPGRASSPASTATRPVLPADRRRRGAAARQDDAAGHVAVLGGGFIGCEVAAAAIRLGKRATILEALPTLLHRALGPELGDVVAGIHRTEGVDVRTGPE